jgi:hypothetical protein
VSSRSGKRGLKYLVCNGRGKTPAEFCKRNGLSMLSGKYGQESEGKFSFINQSAEGK